MPLVAIYLQCGMAGSMKPLIITWQADTQTLVFTGALVVHQAARAARQATKMIRAAESVAAIDLTGVTTLDTVGALLVSQWVKDGARVAYANDTHRNTVEMIAALDADVPPKPEGPSGLAAQVIALGKWASFMGKEAREVLTFTGKAAVLLVRAFANPKRLRFPEIMSYIAQVGVHAMPIIGLIAFLIAIVLAYQAAEQLRPYGGEQFTVDLVAISIFREMGVLLTAIMVAGRSGSAFTAEIGVMKSREEVDALKVMGFDPFDMLVIPRLIAITIALPLLTFFANMMGLVGGYIISHTLIDISLERYLERVHYALDIDALLVGLLKAPFFAFFIGIVGCMHGLRVSGSAESIGRETTAAVVKSIFLVLVLDAFFSVFFQKVGL